VIAETLSLAKADEAAITDPDDPGAQRTLRRRTRKSADRLSRVLMRQQRRLLLRTPEYYRKATSSVYVVVCILPASYRSTLTVVVSRR